MTPVEVLQRIEKLLHSSESDFENAIKLIWDNIPDDYNTIYPSGVTKCWSQIHNLYMDYRRELNEAIRKAQEVIH